MAKPSETSTGVGTGFVIGKNCQIDPTAVINVKRGFLGDGALIRAHARIEGEHVEIGRECFMDLGAIIGGGSCFDPGAFLKAGDWLHLGQNSQINIARGVTVGHEFGCGIETKIFTHGAYIDSYNLGAPAQWAPVEIGDSVWLPNAWVNPGVRIGSNVVVAARSLVNQDIPAGSLAGGVPAKILKSNYLPREQTTQEKLELLTQIVAAAKQRYLHEKSRRSWVGQQDERPPEIKIELDQITILDTDGAVRFDVRQKLIHGRATELSKVVKDQLRRNGIRFRFEVRGDSWLPWETTS